MAGYVAGWNMPGYLPETDPETFETFEDAVAYIAAEIERWRDQDADADIVRDETELHTGHEWARAVYGNYVFWASRWDGA